MVLDVMRAFLFFYLHHVGSLWHSVAVVYSFHTWEQQECGNARVKRCLLCLYTAHSPGGASSQWHTLTHFVTTVVLSVNDTLKKSAVKSPTAARKKNLGLPIDNNTKGTETLFPSKLVHPQINYSVSVMSIYSGRSLTSFRPTYTIVF